MNNPLFLKISQEPAYNLSKMIQSNNHLEELSLKNFSLNDDSFTLIVQGLKENNSIHYLDLTSNKITFKGCFCLKEYLELKKCTLQYLLLANNTLGSHGALMISEILKNNDSLLYLDLNKNKIEGKGIYEIAEALQYNETLRALKLFWNDFDDNSTEGFYNLLNKFRRKIRLDFGVEIDAMEFKLFKKKKYQLFEDHFSLKQFLEEQTHEESSFNSHNFN